MNRHELDDFTERHRLPARTVALALQLTGLRPDATAWRRAGARMLHAAGLACVGAGGLFFVAANWQALDTLGRFALLEAAMLACVAVALWRPSPSPVGQGALVLATLVTGGLLALFGQSYQTGADLYELFFSWALLALPFALAGRSAALWAVWWVVANIDLALLCGLDADDIVWRVLEGRMPDRTAVLMVPCLLDLLGAGAWLLLRRRGHEAIAPSWLPRLLASLGFLFGTTAAFGVVTGAFTGGGDMPRAGVMLLCVVLAAGIGVGAWRLRRDVFPLALIAASAIAVSTSWLVESLRFGDLGALFVVALWLIGASTVSGLVLMHWVRTWRANGSLA